MGLGGIGPWQLIIILLIVVMLFGTKKLRGMGSDLGGALKGFKKAMKEEEPAPPEKIEGQESKTIDGETEKEISVASVLSCATHQASRR